MANYTCVTCKDAFPTSNALMAHGASCKGPKEATSIGLDKVVEVAPVVGETPKKVTRETRKPFGLPTARFSALDKDPNYRYRAVNANWHKDPDRVQRFEEAGYEKVQTEANGRNVGRNEDGSPIAQVLMRQPLEFYEEDQARKEAELNVMDDQIRRGSHPQAEEAGRYIPKAGISLRTQKT